MLSDRSVTVQRETSHALGQGLRLGFLGSAYPCPDQRTYEGGAVTHGADVALPVRPPLLYFVFDSPALHMDVFRQRLEDEYNSDVIITAPSVPYKRASSTLVTARMRAGPSD